MKIYVVSSWRNPHQPTTIRALHEAGHEVYDFRNPAPGEPGFQWSELDPGWMSWSATEFRAGLQDQRARRAFERDRVALEACDACVLVLPSGMSAHLEAGWCAGKGKPVAIYAPDFREAELMYKLFDQRGVTPLFETPNGLVTWASNVQAALRSGDGPILE